MHVYALPTKQTLPRGNRIIDEAALSALIDEHRPCVAMTEDVWGIKGQAGKSMFTFGEAYGAIVTSCAFKRLPLKKVNPKEWQKEIIPGIKSREELKKASIAWARENYPDAILIPPRGRVADHNRADAVCICHYHRIQRGEFARGSA